MLYMPKENITSMYNMWQLNTKMEDGRCLGTKDGILCGYCEMCRYIWRAQSTMPGGIKSHDVWAMENYKEMEEKRVIAKIEKEKLKKEIQRKLTGVIEHEMWTVSLKDYDGKLLNRRHYYEELAEKVEEVVENKKFGFKVSGAVIEYHSGEHPDGGNLHVHILAMRDDTYKPSRRINDMAKYFGVKSNFIDRAKGTKEIDFVNRLNYIYGRKINEDKIDYVRKDRIWRKHYQLPEVTSIFPPEILKLYLREKEEEWYDAEEQIGGE